MNLTRKSKAVLLTLMGVGTVGYFMPVRDRQLLPTSSSTQPGGTTRTSYARTTSTGGGWHFWGWGLGNSWGSSSSPGYHSGSSSFSSGGSSHSSGVSRGGFGSSSSSVHA